MLPARILTQHNPSVFCLKMLLKFKNMLRHIENSKNLKKKSRWEVVEIVRNLLVRLLQLSEVGKLKEWLSSIKEVLQSLSIHFLKLIIVATRRYEYLEKVKEEIIDILKLQYDLLGLSEEALVLVIIKASNALGGESNSYGCQFQLFSLLAREVFFHYLVKEDFQEESALVVWSVVLARLWLVTCDPADKTKVQKKIFSILPPNLKATGKCKMSTKRLLNVPVTQLVKKLGLTASKALKEMDLLLIEEEGSHAYKQLTEMANKIDRALVQLKLITASTPNKKRGKLLSNEFFSQSSDWTTSTPDRQDAATKESSPQVDTGASCSQDFIPSSVKNERSAEEIFENKLKRKRTNKERSVSCDSQGKSLATETGENIDNEEKSLKVRKVSPSTESRGLSENARIGSENMEAPSKGQSREENSISDDSVTVGDRHHVESIQECRGDYKDKQKISKSDDAGGMRALSNTASALQPKASKWKKTRLARTKVETPQKCKAEEKLGQEEDFSLRLESDMENPSPLVLKPEEAFVDERSKNTVKRALLTSADSSSSTDGNEIIKKLASESLQADQQNHTNNKDDKLGQTFSEISEEECKFTEKKKSHTKEEPQESPQKVSATSKTQQNSATEGESGNTSSREDFEDTDSLGKKKLKKKGSESFVAENGAMQNYSGLVKGVGMLDDSVQLPAGWKRLIHARIVQRKKEPKIRIDVKVVSPDGKSHNSRKSVLEHQKKHDPKSVLSIDEVQSWYKIEPQLKERVLQKNEHLVKYIKLRKQAELQERTLRSYTPLKVNINSKKSVSQKKAEKENGKDQFYLVRSNTNQEKQKSESNIEAKESHSLGVNQKAGPRNIYTKSKDENRHDFSLKEEEEEGRALDESKPLDIHDPFEFADEEDTIKEFCPVSKTSCVQDSVVKSEMNVNFDIIHSQEEMEPSHRENLPNLSEQAGSRSENIKNEEGVLEHCHVKRDMLDENSYTNAHPADDTKDENEEYLSVGEDQSQDNSVLFIHSCFEDGTVKPSGPESISSQGPEPTNSSDDMSDKSTVLFILPELCKTKVKAGDIICTKVKKETEQNVMSSARIEERAAGGLTFDNVNNCNNISGTPLSQNEKLLKTDRIEIWKESSHAVGTFAELISEIPCQDDQQINYEVEESGVDLKHSKTSQQHDISIVESQEIKMHSTPAEIVNEMHSPGLSTIKGSSCKKDIQGVVSALNVSGHHPDGQPLVKDIQQVPVLKEITSGERKALITIPPVVSGKDILLELKWYKIVPSEVGRSFLVESSIVTLSHQEILPPTILEKELLAAREMQLARSSQAEGKSSDTFNDCKRKSCNRRLLGEFTDKENIPEEMKEGPFSSNKQVEQSNRGKMDDKVRANEFSLQVFREGNTEQSECGTPMLNSLVQFLDDSPNSEERLQTPNQCTMLTSCSSKTAINGCTIWSTGSNTNHLYNSLTSGNENQVVHSSLLSDPEDLTIIETDSTNGTNYLSYAGRVIMPGKNLKRGLYLCHGSHLAQLQEKIRMPFEVTSKPSSSRICSQHQRNEVWHADGLFDPSLLDLSCPICQLTLEDIRPCTFHPELIQLSEGEAEEDLPTPLEHMTETVRMIYWEYVGILLSLFPGKESLPLPMSWNYMSACSVHGVLNHKDLVATVSPQYVVTKSKSGQVSASTSSQEISQNDYQNTNFSILPQDKCQDFGQHAKEPQQLKKAHSQGPEVKGSALLPGSDPDLHKRKSTYLKSSSRMEKDPRVDKLSRNKKSLQSGKGKHKLMSFLKEKEQSVLVKQKGLNTELQPSHSSGNSDKRLSVSKTGSGKPRPTPKKWKFSCLFSKKFLKAKPQGGKDAKNKGKKTKKCAREKKINKKCLQNVAPSGFIVSPNVYSSDNQTKGKSYSSTRLTQDYFSKGNQGQKKKGDSNVTTSAHLQKEVKGAQTHTSKNKKSKVRSDSDVTNSIEGTEFDALERFKKHQKHAMERSRQKSCVKTK